jgi:tellurite resistance protein TehA-like permease
LWVVLLYGILAVQIASERKATLAEGMNGTWLLITVATQSVAVLGALLAPHMQAWQDQLLFLSFGCFLLGGLLYVIVVTMVLYRVLFHPLPAEAMTPPYWIDMGAEAISTLAGANLILHAGTWNVLQDLLPFLKGLTVLFWATATWWIPLLLLLGVWRHLYRRVPVQYSAQYWSLVFPLGMYAACTSQLMKAMALPLAPALPALFLYVALGAWAVTLWGLLSTYLFQRVPAFTAGS